MRRWLRGRRLVVLGSGSIPIGRGRGASGEPCALRGDPASEIVARGVMVFAALAFVVVATRGADTTEIVVDVIESPSSVIETGEVVRGAIENEGGVIRPRGLGPLVEAVHSCTLGLHCTPTGRFGGATGSHGRTQRFPGLTTSIGHGTGVANQLGHGQSRLLTLHLGGGGARRLFGGLLLLVGFTGQDLGLTMIASPIGGALCRLLLALLGGVTSGAPVGALSGGTGGGTGLLGLTNPARSLAHRVVSARGPFPRPRDLACSRVGLGVGFELAPVGIAFTCGTSPIFGLVVAAAGHAAIIGGVLQGPIRSRGGALCGGGRTIGIILGSGGQGPVPSSGTVAVILAPIGHTGTSAFGAWISRVVGGAIGNRGIGTGFGSFTMGARRTTRPSLVVSGRSGVGRRNGIRGGGRRKGIRGSGVFVDDFGATGWRVRISSGHSIVGATGCRVLNSSWGGGGGGCLIVGAVVGPGRRPESIVGDRSRRGINDTRGV